MKIVVLDDDPTGSQTVHGCRLLLCWDVRVIREGLRDASPLLFILANTRALSSEDAVIRNREICLALSNAIAAEGIDRKNVLIVSRGDSTLRGHGFLEPEIINQELGPFDATFHVPAFLECGRTTVNGVHLLDGVPVHTTPFAQDHCFGYSTSQLASWLEEKSFGLIKKQSVRRISLSQLDDAVENLSGFKSLEIWLDSLKGNQAVVVDAERPSQLKILGKAVKGLRKKKRFLFRSAASFINGLSDVSPKLLDTQALVDLRRRDQKGAFLPGMVIVGSHVPLADLQLKSLLEDSNCEGIELPVKTILRGFEDRSLEVELADLKKTLLFKITRILSSGKTPVLFTSRGELLFSSPQAKLSFGLSLAYMMASLVEIIEPKLGYLISKGGITTNIFLSEGLRLNEVRLEGQILPGLSLVLPFNSDQSIRLPIITFPGNLGDSLTLLDAWKLMELC